MEGRRPVCRPQKTWSKIVEDMRKLNITEDMAEDRHQWRQLISQTQEWETRDEEEEDDDGDEIGKNERRKLNKKESS